MRHSLWQSFQFAGRGLRTAFWSQRTMRIHVGLTALVILLVAWLRLPVGETAVVILCVVAVLAAELLNTAVETVVDLQVGDNRHELAGRAKDLSAAAVVITAAGAAVVGAFVLVPRLAAAEFRHLDAMVVGRAAALVAILALAAVVLRRTGDRTPGRKPPLSRVP
ncbi:MAG: diacylglycerol kinase family protein [Armatimonadota bacterium]|nr:diacylglycerol kinase family protein [Armatimonadota bacterium]